MNKRGKETVLTAYVILMTVALVGGFLAYRISLPTSAVVADIENPVITITSFDAVFDPDGATSMKFAVSAKEHINLGLNSRFWLTIESGNEKMQYEGSVFFEGAVGKVQSLKWVDEDDSINIETFKGTFAVTNALDDTATMLVKLDFKRPLLKNLFVPPRKVLISFDFESYDKTFESKDFPVRHSETPIPFPYYHSNLGIIEVVA